MPIITRFDFLSPFIPLMVLFLYVRQNGTVYSFGVGSSGQLGLGHMHTVYVPCAVQLPAGYRYVREFFFGSY